MGHVHSDAALDMLVDLWHGHAQPEGDHWVSPTGPRCPLCRPLHFLLGWSWEEYRRWAETSVQPERKEPNIGTRGVVGFVLKGEAKTSYNHFDSYPEALGVDMLGWLRLLAAGEATFPDKERQGWPSLARQAEQVRLLDETEPAPEEAQRALAEVANFGVSSGATEDAYCLTRNMQGKLGEMIHRGWMLSDPEFPLDSLFCEWGYILNFDTETFEVYKGFQKAYHEEGHWGGCSSTRDGYFPIRLVKSWPLAALPTQEEFLAAFAKDDED